MYIKLYTSSYCCDSVFHNLSVFSASVRYLQILKKLNLILKRVQILNIYLKHSVFVFFYFIYKLIVVTRYPFSLAINFILWKTGSPYSICYTGVFGPVIVILCAKFRGCFGELGLNHLFLVSMYVDYF